MCVCVCVCVCMCVCVPDSLSNYLYFIYMYKLAIVVEGDQKAPFSIATTPSCRGGRYSFHWIARLYP